MSTPFLPPSITALRKRIRPLPLPSVGSLVCSAGSIGSASASRPIAFAVWRSIRRVASMLPHIAPRLPHSAASPTCSPPAVPRPIMNVVTIRPMPKLVPRFVSAGI